MTRPGRYAYFGLDLASSLALHELPRFAAERRASAPDVELTIGQVRPVLRRRLAVRPGRVDLSVPQIGRFRAEAGRHLWIGPAPEATNEGLRAFLLGTMTGALLQQRGRLVLHGSAVLHRGGAVILLGSSGDGKSTLAAQLFAGGASLLADDIASIAIEPEPLLATGIPRLKLSETSLGALPPLAGRVGRPLFDGMEGQAGRMKRPFRPSVPPPPGPHRISAIVVLERGERLFAERLGGASAVAPILQHSFRRELLDGQGLIATHLAHCAELAARAPVWRLTRRWKLDTLAGAAALLLESVSAENCKKLQDLVH